jgi:pSer/pThr/pTyr-binding forkhead associated (FHA) protein
VPVPPTIPQAPTEAARGDERPPLATLEIVSEGSLKGTRFDIRVPLTHVGRGAHNDVVLADDSVSDSHAKLQKREAGWYVVDMGSTNGTWVGGQRIAGESALGAHTSVRFGKIRATFEPVAEPREGAGGTRVIAGLSADQVRKMSREAEIVAPPEPPAKSGVPAWVWVLVLVLVAAGAFFILKVR